jgi:hypothetical protein
VQRHRTIHLLTATFHASHSSLPLSLCPALQVASTNLQDFYNLVDVYLDAVLHPKCVEDPRIFAQEGWHYELDDKEASPAAGQQADFCSPASSHATTASVSACYWASCACMTAYEKDSLADCLTACLNIFRPLVPRPGPCRGP